MREDARVKVLVAPDRFGVELAAAEAADAVALGWLRSAPYDEVDLLPLSDGGPGFVDVLGTAARRQVGVVTVRGPLGDPVPARVLQGGDTAYVEAAEAVGLHLVAAGPPRPRSLPRRTAWGSCCSPRRPPACDRVVVGVGGTATTDGGRGLVAALDGHRDELAGLELVAATATDAPLMGHSGAAHGFAAGKGADRAARDALETALREWATETDGGLAVRPGAGAGGGIGFGLMLLGAERVNGTALVARGYPAGRPGPGGGPGGDRAGGLRLGVAARPGGGRRGPGGAAGRAARPWCWPAGSRSAGGSSPRSAWTPPTRPTTCRSVTSLTPRPSGWRCSRPGSRAPGRA